MAGTSSTLSLASPLAVSRALAGTGSYRFGTPGDGLSVSIDAGLPPRIRFTSDGTLTEDDVYVAPLNDWIDYLVGLGFASEVVTLLLTAIGRGKRAKISLSILGYIPLRLTIPRKGTLVYSPHGKIVLNGAFGAAGQPEVEQWSCSMSYDVVGPDVGAMPATLPEATLQAISDAWASFFTNNTFASFPSNVSFTGTSYYRAQADGTATGGVWQRHFRQTAARGVQATFNPLQIAQCISLDAGGPRGGRFGRFYLPPISAGVSADGRWLASISGPLATQVTTALAAVNAALSDAVEGDVELVVASGRGSGENRPVRAVRVGRVPDTVRSRRASLLEEYTVTPFQSIP